MKFLHITVVGAMALLAVGASDLRASHAATKEGRDQYVRITRAAIESFRQNRDGFRLSLEYHGPQPATYYSVHLSVEPLADKRPASHLMVQVDKEQAAVIVGHLAVDGFLYRGAINASKLLVQPREPYYFLLVQFRDGEQYFEYLPCAKKAYRWHWMTRAPLAEQLASLRAVLWGGAADAMDKLARAVEADKQGQRHQTKSGGAPCPVGAAQR